MEQFLQFLVDLRAKVNAQLAALPPLEQFEAASQLSWPFKQLMEYGKNLSDTLQEFQGKLDQYNSDTAQKLRGDVQAELLKEGVVLLKADAETAANAARERGIQEERTRHQAELAEAQTIKDRRAQVVQDKVIPAVLAERLGDDVFKGDNFMATVQKIAGRALDISKLGLAPDGANAALAEMASIPADEAGDAVFAQRLATIQQIAGGAASRGEHAERGGGQRSAKVPLDAPGSETPGKRRYAF